MIDLCHLDEAGFAMTQPTTFSWYPKGERLAIPFEANQGRRVNAIGAVFTNGPQAGQFEFATRVSLPLSKAQHPRKSREAIAEAHGVAVEAIGPITGEVLVDFLWAIAGRPLVADAAWKRERPLFIVLDNYSVHKGEAVKAATAAWEAAGIHLVYLPSYSPKLSKIEPIWQDTKHHEMTQRSNERLGDLQQNVEGALRRKAKKLQIAYQTHHSLAQAA